MRVLVILNGRAGTLVKSGENPASVIRERFALHGIDCEVRDVAGEELTRITRQVVRDRSADMIVAGGGDGTLNTIASAMVGSDIAFGVLPLGTFNHFARELQIPLEIESAIDALATGKTVPLAIGQVNDHYFLLSCAIGLYSDMVRHRDAQREALGRRKMWAGTIAFCKMIVRWPLMRVKLCKIQSPPHDDFSRLTSTTYVSLSGYQMEEAGLCDVPADARDALTILLSRHIRRRALIGFLFKAILRLASSRTDLEQIRAQQFELIVRGRTAVRVGYDGEVESMQTPLKIARVSDALQIRVPSTFQHPIKATISESEAVPLPA